MDLFFVGVFLGGELVFEVEEVGGFCFVEEGELVLVGEVEGEELLVLWWG